MARQGICVAAALALLLAGCTVISVEGDHNRIRDAGGHGGVALPEGGESHPWVQRLERIEKALGIGNIGPKSASH